MQEYREYNEIRERHIDLLSAHDNSSNNNNDRGLFVTVKRRDHNFTYWA